MYIIPQKKHIKKIPTFNANAAGKHVGGHGGGLSLR
jgi:hypothetical protein